MSDLTPMMQQYTELKKKNKDAILLFRLGDFYEMFGEDAHTASRILQITLTARSAGEGRLVKMPMCGVPYHAANNYILKLINNGYKVAICEQVEDPKLAKGLVRREIVKIITPGTVLDDNGLDRKTNNYIMALCIEKKAAGMAFIDLSTGEFYAGDTDFDGIDFERLVDEVEKIGPAEILLPEAYAGDTQLEKKLISRLRTGAKPVFINYFPDMYFTTAYAREKLLEHFKTKDLSNFGIEDQPPVIAAAGALLSCLYETQKTVLFHINRLSLYSKKENMHIDAVSMRNLEIAEANIKSGKFSTLFSVLDNTQTAMGGRELKKWVKFPLTDIKKIKDRQDIIQALVDSSDTRENLKEVLGQIADVERIAGKLGSQSINGRDLNALKKAVELAAALEKTITRSEIKVLKNRFVFLNEALTAICELIGSAIVEDPPIAIKDGGVINSDYSPELKKLKSISGDAKQWIAALQESERKRTGIGSLKVGYTSVFGYYIEISKTQLKHAPEDYIRKQTLVSAERFITPQLKEYESMIFGADDKIKAMEYSIFCGVRDEAGKHIVGIQELASKIAELDCLLALAITAFNGNYVRPEINSGTELVIEEGRHPVIEKNIGYNEFIGNDTYLNCKDEMISVITGPNMAGKSTYMRQVAIITIMAQTGSFVPAKAAKIGIVDKIFTRVGAADYLARGQSTFMVEMIETANILNNATGKSLILLDEVGRGTSTFDGISIAWAITEYIHNQIKAKTLFATHYYELTEISELLEGVKNYNIQVKEWGDKIIFLRKIVKGSTDRSYGIHVAQLAGLPEMIIDRANKILKKLEDANYTKDGKSKIAGADYHNAPPDLFSFSNEQKIVDALEKINVDEMTPVEALNKLKELKDEIK
ncbi:MAG: DNA mismatch repair protein MutS [bacterium]